MKCRQECLSSSQTSSSGSDVVPRTQLSKELRFCRESVNVSSILPLFIPVRRDVSRLISGTPFREKRNRGIEKRNHTLSKGF